MPCKGAFELRAAALLLDQIAGALSLAHRNGVIHRDIKPGNILLDEDGNAYLTDFGIAKDLNLSISNTQPDAIVGSLDYISPEQARSESVTARTDIYSLGVTLYEVITGHHPFENMSSVERLYKHINDPLPEINTIEPNMQDAVNHVIQKATAKNPEQRYPDALAFAADFREAIGMNRTSTTVEELLTQREHEILQMIIDGLANKEIAERLTVTLGTVKWYVNQIYSKLGVRSRVQAIVRARELNLIVKPGEVTAAVPIPTEDFHPQNPYKGLLAFQAADHQDFFGREKVTAKLVKRLSETGDTSRFLAVVGPSGSGKSSLVKAGLIPALWRGDLPGSEKWFVVEMLPGTRPIDELEVALMKIAANQAGNLGEHLQRDKYGLVRAAGLILPNDGSELVLVIDQFEEVFTLLEDEAARVHFLDLLHAAVTEPRSRVRVVITLRADFYDRPLHYPQFGELVRTRLETIMPLSAEELERAIAHPAERVGVTFEPGLVTAIIGDVNYQPGALPLLQYALTELFEQRKGRLLTREAYQAIGGTVGALAKRAEEVYLSLDEDDQEVARQMFLRLVTLGEGTEDTRRRTARSELQAIAADADTMDEIIDTFASYRLLSLDIDPGTRSPTVEVAHEALLREWERLRAWLNESRDEIRIQRQLSAMAQEWRDSGQDSSFLARGSRLEQFEQWVAETRLAVTSQEHDFLNASLTEREHQMNAERKRQVREQHLERRSRNFLRGLVAVFALAAIVSSGLAVFALDREGQAQAARDNSERSEARAIENANYASSIALASAAKSAQLSNNPDQAITLAVAANTITDNPPAFAQSVLYDVAFVPATRSVFTQRSRGPSVVSPDGERALTLHWEEWSEGSETVVYWDLNTGEILGRWMDERPMCQLIFGPSGETGFVTTAEPDYSAGAVIEFELTTGQEIRRFTPSEGFPCEIAFSPDSQTLFAQTYIYQEDSSNFLSAYINTWEVTTGRHIQQVGLDTSGVGGDRSPGTRFSQDLQKILVTYGTGLIFLWDTNTGELIRIYGETDAWVNPVRSAFFTSAGIVTAIADYPTTTTIITLWNETTGELLQQETWPVFGGSYDLSPDGRLLALAIDSPHIILFDVQTWQITHELHGHGTSGNLITFTPDGQYLLSVSDDQTMRLWNLEDGAEIVRMDGLTELVSGIVISPDGSTLLSQEFNGSLTLWNLETGEQAGQLGQTQNGRRNIAFSPDGKYVAFSNSAQDAPAAGCPGPGSELILKDVASGEIVWQARKEIGYMNPGITFTRDGSRILTVDWFCENVVRVWDAATGEQLDMWESHQAPILPISASPDGKWIATGSRDQTAILWDAATGTIVHTLQHDARVGNVAFSPDSTRLLTAGENGVLHIWDTDSGQEVQQLTGHTSLAPNGQFSPDGQYFVSGGRDNNIFVWDWQAGEAVRQFQFTRPMIYGISVVFSPDGQSIVMADENNVIRKIDLMLEPGQLLEWIYANRYVRDLTCDERRLYQVEPLCSDVVTSDAASE